MELNRVLIVDDDPAIRRVVSALLDLDEYGLLEAADGQAALEVVRDERPDLVILALHDGPRTTGPRTTGVCGQPGARHSLSPLRSPSGGG